eukprot:340557_1
MGQWSSKKAVTEHRVPNHDKITNKNQQESFVDNKNVTTQQSNEAIEEKEVNMKIVISDEFGTTQNDSKQDKETNTKQKKRFVIKVSNLYDKIELLVPGYINNVIAKLVDDDIFIPNDIILLIRAYHTFQDKW